MAPIAIRRRRSFFLTLILIAILGYAGLSIWSFKLQEDGVPRGSWSARSMPAMLNAFPVFETCGPVMQRLEGRDGERAQANFVSYASSLSAEALLGRYRTALASLGCTVSPGDAALSLSLACPGQAVSGFDIEVTDGPSCRSVEAFWWGGED